MPECKQASAPVFGRFQMDKLASCGSLLQPMSIIGTLAKKLNYSVTVPSAGRLVYREGNREYTFPVYEEQGAVVVVGTPSSERVHFFFNWYPSRRDFPPAARARILPRLEAHLRAGALSVRVHDREAEGACALEFHPELFAHRGRASELLESAGYSWFSDYSSIDPVHEDYGLEICGIQNDRHVKPILDALQAGFPHWHHHHYCLHEAGREPGWSVTLCMFPPKACNSGRFDGD